MLSGAGIDPGVPPAPVILRHVLETHSASAAVRRTTLLDLIARDRPLRTALLVGLGSLLIAASARVAVPLPFSPVPVTAQTFAVLLIAAALGPRAGAACVLLYLAEGAMGLPVFAPGGAPGFARLLGPTAGYLVGFVIAALVVGSLARIGWDRRFVTAVVTMVLGSAIIDAAGLLWLARFVPAERLLDAGLYPFIPGDLYKSIAAAAALPACWRIVWSRP